MSASGTLRKFGLERIAGNKSNGNITLLIGLCIVRRHNIINLSNRRLHELN